MVAASYGKHFDELYAYDLIHRLKHMERGDLNALKGAVSNLQFAQCWKLDETGNWSNFREDDDGDSSWDLVQNRTNNKVNEITDVTETTGPSWVTPVYSKAGNMTTVLKPADPTVGFTCTYDAWNRLVKIEEADDTVAEYEYDGAKRRAIKKVYSGGILDETRHLYYTDPSRWQVVEERVDASSDPDRQFVWGLRYIDDIALRDRDTTDDGTLDERLYGMQDANWNVTLIADETGTAQERYSYTSYGFCALLTRAFESRVASDYEWEVLFTGQRWDRESGLLYFRTRHLHARLGRFLSRDPREYVDGLHLYCLLNNRPTVFVDPMGTLTVSWSCWAAIAAMEATWFGTVVACLSALCPAATPLALPGCIAGVAATVAVIAVAIGECVGDLEAQRRIRKLEKRIDALEERLDG